MTETSPPLESGGLAAAAVESAPKAGPVRRIRVTDFHTAKQQHERWAMLTSYDQYTAALFDEAGVWALLVGDSAAKETAATNFTRCGRRRTRSPTTDPRAESCWLWASTRGDQPTFT